MKKSDFMKKLSSQLCDAMPAHLKSFKKDFEKNCHGILSKAFNKFDLVTREEFDTQTKVLQRSRKKLEELENHMLELEGLLKNKRKKNGE